MNDLNKIIIEYNNGNISTKELFEYTSTYIDKIKNMTSFLDSYDVTLPERLYYLVHNISSVIKCKYCGSKTKWSGRFKDGYKEICGSKECRSKQLSESHKGLKNISINRDMNVCDIISNVIDVNDTTIIDVFKYDKYVEYVHLNKNIEQYLTTRFIDSSSVLETVQRIRLGILEKPVCPVCGKPVNWIGKRSKLYTTYCGNQCAAKERLVSSSKVMHPNIDVNKKKDNQQINPHTQEKNIGTHVDVPTNTRFGFLRESSKYTTELDPDFGLHRTSLLDYLLVIFPEVSVSEWIHDQKFGKLKNGKICFKRPDYKCEKLKLIIEFDGLHHYTDPKQIIQDEENTKIYVSEGYNVVRIPYFIQLTNRTVQCMFGRNVDIPLFDPNIPSFGILSKSTPAFCCPLGINRMAKELIKFPEQMDINIKELEKYDDVLTGLSYLKNEIKKYKK